jgi:hypothetical protein
MIVLVREGECGGTGENYVRFMRFNLRGFSFARNGCITGGAPAHKHNHSSKSNRPRCDARLFSINIVQATN